MRIAPARKLTVEDAGEPLLIDHVVAGPEIAMTQHEIAGCGRVPLEPA